MIEDILVLEEQDFNPSLVVVAVSGGEPCLKTFVVHVEPSLRYSGLVNQSDVVVFGYSLGMLSTQQFKAQVLLVAGVGGLSYCIGTDGVKKLGQFLQFILHHKFILYMFFLIVRDLLSNSLQFSRSDHFEQLSRYRCFFRSSPILGIFPGHTTHYCWSFGRSVGAWPRYSYIVSGLIWAYRPYSG